MRIPRIYTTTQLAGQSHVKLEEAVAHYLGKVLRMSAGRELILFNGEGGEYQATVTDITKKSVTVNIGAYCDENRESPLNTHLAIGLSRGERWDLVLQKATELGVTQITPLFTERSEVKLTGERLTKKISHWQGIIISACEQCQRNILPRLNEPVAFSDFLAGEHSELNLVLHHRSQKRLADYPTPSSCTMLIGPEGGLSDEEITQAQKQSFNALTLGPRVLRTETAPLAALSALQLVWGDF
ncbi:MAG TPA: 16S rRNA (uracil(1498)-N(3))-methyltransferase [Marinagarivorans sp.]